jgi:hypothetical protein
MGAARMSDWYTDYRQNEQLEELRSEMSQAMSEASSLRSRLSELQGGLESRLERLASAFDAFVELSDIRYDLIGFADAAEVRRHAGQVLSALASGEDPPAPGREVPGYWLGPAVEALRGLSAEADGPVADELAGEPLAEAMTRDDRRTSIFLCLALAALGRRNQVRSQWLDIAFGPLAADGTVTRVQRALWTAGARGGFGADGLDVIVAWLQVPSTASAQRWLAPIEARSEVVRQAAPNFAEIADQAKARARLSRLRAAVETIAGDTAVLEPDRDLAYADAGQTDLERLRPVADSDLGGQRARAGSAGADHQTAGTHHQWHRNRWRVGRRPGWDGREAAGKGPRPNRRAAPGRHRVAGGRRRSLDRRRGTGPDG